MRKRAIDLESLAILNEYIVQRLQSGIVVLDDNFRIVLLNESAKNIFGEYNIHNKTQLSELSVDLDQKTRDWKEGRGKQSTIIKLGNEKVDIQVSFTSLKIEKKFEILIFLEDVSTLRQRAQQMKLASLGRLTASIAHEVRNPLGAISHAGQLLTETDSITDENRRLTTIIDEQSRRVNNVIENVMSISRRQQAAPTIVKLDDWLRKFVQEFTNRYELAPDALKLFIESENIYASMDPEQLHQAVWNLSENGIRYSKGNPLLEFRCEIIKKMQRPYIDVIDHGPGISDDVEEQLFEPFITTSSKGSGLGLYIARELCEANQATLSLISNTENGCCFRIYFSHYEKQHNIL